MSIDKEFKAGRIIPATDVPETITVKTEKGIVRGIPLWTTELQVLLPGYTINTHFVSPWDHNKRVRFVLVEEIDNRIIL